MDPAFPIVTVMIPCRNERKWIRRCVESVMKTDYPVDRLEILIGDGMSDDGTRDVLFDLEREYPALRAVDNPSKIVSTGLNRCLEVANGEVVVRMDAHSEYPAHYIPRLVQVLQETGADNVGGKWITEPANDGWVAHAIAEGTSHRFGVGNSLYRTPGSSGLQDVDTVPFGCFRRDVFAKVGTFDTELVRNQDDELNNRILNHGGRIVLVPDVQVKYFARDSLGKLWRMYYQYGYYKALVIRKTGRPMTGRQLVPPLFVLAVCLSALGALWSTIALVALAGCAGLYVCAVGVVACHVAFTKSMKRAMLLPLVFPCIHFAYGIGMLHGAARFLLLRRNDRVDVSDVKLTR